MSPAGNRDIPPLELPTDGSLSHNWLYSFLPIGKENYPGLVGFCKQCRHTFSYVMKIQDPIFVYSKDYPVLEEFDAQIPKYGCVPIE